MKGKEGSGGVSELLLLVRLLVSSGQRRITAHAHKRLADHAISLKAALEGLSTALVVEEYPNYYAGPAVLVLQPATDGRPLHVLWGMPKSGEQCAYMITAYRPDPQEWADGFLKRKPME